MRAIPATMATQHPDNASVVPFLKSAFVNTLDEVEECYRAFHDLGIGEYMWDWEGKFVDEAVVEKLYQQYGSFFRRKPLGRDSFLTFRIPNMWEQKGYRVARAYMSILTASDFASEFGFHTPPIFEVILPMTKRATQLIQLQEMFVKVSRLKDEIFEQHDGKGAIPLSLIPLFEEVPDLLNSPKTLTEYLALYKKTFGTKPPYIRPFLARSDPALNAGLIPAVLAAKGALGQFTAWSERHGVPLYPIIGTGSLPFRGGVNPDNIKETIGEYQGVRTLTLQSAFRYDYPPDAVKKAIQYITKKLPTLEPLTLSAKEIAQLHEIAHLAIPLYQKTVTGIARLINSVAAKMPRRRERLLHIGLYGYSRGIGKVQLPRAITFTGALYSLGVPPEFIGTGRVLTLLREKKLLALAEKVYVTLRADLHHAGKYLNHENLEILAQRNPYFKEIAHDVRLVMAYMGESLGPYKTNHFIHRNLTSTILFKMKAGQDYTEELIKAAVIRKSLG